MEKDNNQLTLSGYIEDLNKKEENPDAVQETSQPRRKLDKPKWYTVRPGIEFRTGPLGSDVGEFLGRTEKPTKIRRIGKSIKRHNGIASIPAIIEVDKELRQAWFNLKDLRGISAAGATKNKK